MLAGVFAGGLSCATPTAKPGEAQALAETVERLRVQNAAYAKQIEELENRVFVLQDRLESRDVVAARAAVPELPQVKLHRGEGAPGAADEPRAPEGGPIVEYVGEAALSRPERPILRLAGDETPPPGGVMAGGTSPSLVTMASARAAAPASPLPAPASVSDADGNDATGIYRQALDALRAGQHAEAMAGFEIILKRFPAHDLADNAQYWLGECHYDRRDFPAAVRAFRRVVEKYPLGNKVPDAMLKVGLAYLALGSETAARDTLTQLVRSYPKHPAAVIATVKLAEGARAGDAAGPEAKPFGVKK